MVFRCFPWIYETFVNAFLLMCWGWHTLQKVSGGSLAFMKVHFIRIVPANRFRVLVPWQLMPLKARHLTTMIWRQPIPLSYPWYKMILFKQLQYVWITSSQSISSIPTTKTAMACLLICQTQSKSSYRRQETQNWSDGWRASMQISIALIDSQCLLHVLGCSSRMTTYGSTVLRFCCEIHYGIWFVIRFVGRNGNMWCYLFGSLFEHCTSAPLWVNDAESLVTIFCPKDEP